VGVRFSENISERQKANFTRHTLISPIVSYRIVSYRQFYDYNMCKFAKFYCIISKVYKVIPYWTS